MFKVGEKVKVVGKSAGMSFEEWISCLGDMPKHYLDKGFLYVSGKGNGKYILSDEVDSLEGDLFLECDLVKIEGESVFCYSILDDWDLVLLRSGAIGVVIEDKVFTIENLKQNFASVFVNSFDKSLKLMSKNRKFDIMKYKKTNIVDALYYLTNDYKDCSWDWVRIEEKYMIEDNHILKNGEGFLNLENLEEEETHKLLKFLNEEM